ncbi:MAG: sigma-70 family RNA polymerase sigma factor [Gemmatimonadota bacterium]|nr:sigma-70 family RNA polymerase sigma factor [Gemmatimonadota bacterium]MDH5758513.1 sigma-70 family RNA polymerase sigma factor [Gemmatimonadota bacterium]
MNTPETVTDGALVGLARQGDERAFSELVSRYMRAAYAVALSVTGRHEDAEDAAQESLLVALQRLEECREPERFAGWLMTIVRNRARNLVRREALRDTDVIPVNARSAFPQPDRVLEQVELGGRLREALGSLPEVQQQVVLLHDLEGWKHREIAERLDLPAGTVRSHLHFARKALRDFLGTSSPDTRGEGGVQ